MFCKIGEERIKISSINGYTKKGKCLSNDQFYMELKVSNRTRLIYFKTEKELEDVIDYLDAVLKVSTI